MLKLCMLATIRHARELLLVVGVDGQVGEGVDEVIGQIESVGESAAEVGEG